MDFNYFGRSSQELQRRFIIFESRRRNRKKVSPSPEFTPKNPGQLQKNLTFPPFQVVSA
ncbi:MAG: hypothetical protein JWM68_1082 [Verrucomicrobiales bacterium]|nr:hypothetical protein [Verrucomicrobiales bacterium]